MPRVYQGCRNLRTASSICSLCACLRVEDSGDSSGLEGTEEGEGALTGVEGTGVAGAGRMEGRARVEVMVAAGRTAEEEEEEAAAARKKGKRFRRTGGWPLFSSGVSGTRTVVPRAGAAEEERTGDVGGEPAIFARGERKAFEGVGLEGEEGGEETNNGRDFEFARETGSGAPSAVLDQRLARHSSSQ